MKDAEDACAPLGRQLSEPARFAYAGLCGVSLAQLFPEKEQRSFCAEFVEDFVMWLALSDSVLPAMEAFSGGLGGEATETFTQLLLEEPPMKVNPSLITQELVTFSLRDGYYDARARVLITRITQLLGVPEEAMEIFEESLTESLKETNVKPSKVAEASRKKREKRTKLTRYLLIGLATVGGGTVIGLTGGLAAPLVAAGAATIIGTAGAAALGSTAGIAIMASLFGAAGAGLTGYKMKKRVGAIEEFEFLPLTGGRHLHICIAITGWLCTGKYGSFAAPWQSLLHSTEQYCLAWESKYLMELGNTLDALLNGLVNIMAQEALKYTVLSGIVTALTWPASLLTVASVIDNPWGVCLSRSAEVGKHLAHILLSRPQGRRPVTLVGFSLGARVIYFCLQEMAREKDCEGIIEDVVLLGAPVEGDAKYWRPLTRVVAGRIINGYCRGDWLLSFVYRSSSVKLNVAGLQPVRLDDRRMLNVDLSSVVNGHLDYMKQMEVLLKAVGIKTQECYLGEFSARLLSEKAITKGESACSLGAGERGSAPMKLAEGTGEGEQGSAPMKLAEGTGEEEQGSAPLGSAEGTGEALQSRSLLQPAEVTGEGEQSSAQLLPAEGSGEGEQGSSPMKPAEGTTCIEATHGTCEDDQSSAPMWPAEGTGEGEQGSAPLGSAESIGEGEQGSAPLGSAEGTGEGEQSSDQLQPAEGRGEALRSRALLQPAEVTGEEKQSSALLESAEGNTCIEATHGTCEEDESSALMKPAEGTGEGEHSSDQLPPAEGTGEGEHSSDQLPPAEGRGEGGQKSATMELAEGRGEREQSSDQLPPAEGNTCIEGSPNPTEGAQSSTPMEPAEGSVWRESTHSHGNQQKDTGDAGWTCYPEYGPEGEVHLPDTLMDYAQAL